MTAPNPAKLLDWRKALIYTHRWAGIVLTVVFVIWFVSGIVFMYVGMPTLPAEERLLRMEPLDLTSLRIAPADAAARTGLDSPSRVRIAMHDGRPVYRLLSGTDWRVVFADTGEPLDGVTADDAMALMRRYVPEHAGTLRYERRLTDSDQWTLQSVIRTNMPMHRIALGDDAGTEYYVSEKTAEPVIRTTASGRFWGYLGAVLHWLYFTPLRRHAEVWNSVVVWSSLLGAVMCGMGIVIGIWRYSLSGRFRLRRTPSHTPYTGWMKWHHYTGLVFGFFACTWAFSGALSLSPFDVLRASPASRAIQEAATGGPVDLTPLTVDRIRQVDAAVARSFTPRELDFFQFQGEPYFVAYVPPSASESAPWRNAGIAAATSLHIDREHVFVSALRPEDGTFAGFDRQRMWDVAAAAMPGVPVQDSAWLNEYDAYYYSRDGMRSLPVLRIRYADPQQTWLYLDPARGVIASRLERASRWNRWLYHGFHSLDFPFMYYKRPLWDIVVILLSLGGIAISVTSGLPAWRRLARHVRGISARLSPGDRVPRPLAGGVTSRTAQETAGLRDPAYNSPLSLPAGPSPVGPARGAPRMNHTRERHTVTTADHASTGARSAVAEPGLSRRAIIKTGAAGALAAASFAGDALAQTAPAAPAVLTGAVAGMRYRAFMRRQGQPVVAEVILRELHPRHVLVRTEASSGCYTSAGQVLGGGGGNPNRASIPNHSGAGTVIAVGTEVRRARVGDRVIVSGTSQCGLCYQCLHGAPEACNYLAVPARVIGDLDDGTEVVQAGNIGGFAELMVALEEYCVPCFTDLPSDQLALLGDTFGAGFASTQTYAPVQVGSDVVIFGAGPVGLAAVQGAAANSAAQIIVVEPIAYRRERAQVFGATTTLDPNADTDTLVNRIRAMCSGPTDRLDAGGRIAAGFFSPTGADFVIEASGGDFRPPDVEAGPDPTGILALEQAWAVTRGGGHLTTLAIGQRGTISFNPTFFCVSTRNLHGGQMGGQWVLRDNARFIRAAEAGRIDIGALVTARYPLTAAGVVEGFEKIVGRTELGVIFDPRL